MIKDTNLVLRTMEFCKLSLTVTPFPYCIINDNTYTTDTDALIMKHTKEFS